jgi:hypothetical protein
LTLIEMTLVIATMALLMGLAVPAGRALMTSFQTQGGVKSMIEAALSSARAMAMSTQNYVGIRFEKRCTSDDAANPIQNVLTAPQYMIFIMHEEPKKIGLANGFRAIDGLEPIKLPETMGVMDLSQVTSDTAIDELSELSDATTFSIIFAPSGKVVVHEVRVRNRDGVYQPKNDAGSTQISNDDVFNSVDNICKYKRGMFVQDDYSKRNTGTDGMELGLGKEDSRTSFVIYELSPLRAAYGSRAWTMYLSGLVAQTLYVSPYAGNLIATH